MDLDLNPATATVSTTSTASREDLWEVASNPGAVPAFSNELQAVRIEGPIGVGTVFEGDQRRGQTGWTTTSTVTEFEPLSIFSWSVGDVERPVSSWTFEVIDHGDHRELRQSLKLFGAPSGLKIAMEQDPDNAEAILAGRVAELTANMQATVEGLAALAESA